MIVLALDLTAEPASIAILNDGQVLYSEAMTSPDGFAHVIFDRLQNALKSAGLHLKDIDCFASASGPGSFTGVRVGLAAVKGLAEVESKPAIGVSNLRALAKQGTAQIRITVINARRDELYLGVYNAAGQPLTNEIVGGSSQLLDLARQFEPAELITLDAGWLRERLHGSNHERATVTQAQPELAIFVGQCAVADLTTGETHDPAALDANYVRRSDAELFWTDR